jgi:hypothetical protein
MKQAFRTKLIVLLTVLLAATLGVSAQEWGWKKATTVDDVYNFLNGTGAYKRAVAEAKICAVAKGEYLEFYVFYQGFVEPPGNWGWKKASTVDDVYNFLNGTGAYKAPIKRAEICSVNKGTYLEFYVFYKRL